MGYVEKLLSKGESIIVRTRQHWITLLTSTLINGFIVVVAIVLGVLLTGVLPKSLPEFVPNGVKVATLIVGLFGVLRLGWDILQWSAEEYIVSTHRVIQTEGIVNKKTTDSSLEKINDVVLVQSVFGRILSYGDLEVVTGSDIGVNRLARIDRPVAFKTAMLDQKNKLGHDFEGRAPDQAPDSDVPKLIQELDELRKKGLITDAEFNDKKAKLLSQL